MIFYKINQKENTPYLEGDSTYWVNTPEEYIKIGAGKKSFVCYSLRHFVRLKIGVHGSLGNGYYFYNIAMNKKRLNNLLNRLVNIIPTCKTKFRNNVTVSAPTFVM